jgi:ABC-type proline/glycine betaine transport system substrate-binding protein
MKRFSIYLALGALLLSLFSSLAAADAQPIKMVYSDTKECIAKTYMAKYILEQKVGIKVEITKMSIEEAWKNIAESKYDAMLCASLPEQKVLYEKYKMSVVDFGPNCRDKATTGHTIVRKGLQEKRPALARFLYNFFLCGRKLDSMIALVQGNEIPEKVAHKWMKDHDDWVINMMGLCQGFARRDWGDRI